KAANKALPRLIGSPGPQHVVRLWPRARSTGKPARAGLRDSYSDSTAEWRKSDVAAAATDPHNARPELPERPAQPFVAGRGHRRIERRLLSRGERGAHGRRMPPL